MREDSMRVYKAIVGANAAVVTAVTTAQSTGWEVVPPISAINTTQCMVTLHKTSKSGNTLVISAA